MEAGTRRFLCTIIQGIVPSVRLAMSENRFLSTHSNSMQCCSLFARRRDEWADTSHDLEAHYAIPPLWSEDPDPSVPRKFRELVMVETSMKEPDCPDDWCGTVDTEKWGGPAKEGFLLMPDKKEIPFHPKPYAARDEL
jgi:hypothetical protein